MDIGAKWQLFAVVMYIVNISHGI